MGLSVATLKQNKNEYSVSQINSKILKKHNINLSVSKFKFLLPLLPKRKIIVGNAYNDKQQKAIYVYDIDLISKRLKELGY